MEKKMCCGNEMVYQDFQTMNDEVSYGYICLYCGHHKTTIEGNLDIEDLCNVLNIDTNDIESFDSLSDEECFAEIRKIYAEENAVVRTPCFCDSDEDPINEPDGD